MNKKNINIWLINTYIIGIIVGMVLIELYYLLNYWKYSIISIILFGLIYNIIFSLFNATEDKND